MCTRDRRAERLVGRWMERRTSPAAVALTRTSSSSWTSSRPVAHCSPTYRWCSPTWHHWTDLQTRKRHADYLQFRSICYTERFSSCRVGSVESVGSVGSVESVESVELVGFASIWFVCLCLCLSLSVWLCGCAHVGRACVRMYATCRPFSMLFFLFGYPINK